MRNFVVGAALAVALALQPAMARAQATSYEGYEQELAGIRAQIEATDDPGEKAYAYAQSALLLLGLNRTDEALADIERGKALLRPEDAVPRGELLYTEAYYFRQQQRPADCEANMREARPIYVENYGGEHPYLAMIESLLATCLQDQGEYREAIDLTRHTDAIFARQGPEYGTQRATSLITLGKGLQSANMMKEAEEIFREALVPARQMPEKHPIRFNALDALGGNLLTQGRPLEAQPLLEEAIREATENPGISRAQLAVAMSEYANALLQLDRPTDALPIFLESATMLDEAGYPLPAATTRRNAAIAADRAEDAQMALDLTEQAHAAIDAAPEAGALRIATLQLGEVPMLVEAGRLDQAEVSARAAAEAFSHLRDPGHSQATAARMQLGWVLARRGKAQEGAAIAREAFETSVESRREREFVLNRPLDSLPAIVEYSQVLETARLAGDLPLAFDVMQAIVQSDASRAAFAVAAREAATDSELGALLRKRQEAGLAVAEADSALLAAEAADAPEQGELLGRLHLRHVALSLLDEELDRRFPAYRELIQPRPATLPEMRASLGEDEALLVIAESDRGLHTLAVTREGVALGFDPVRRESLRELVGSLRAGIDRSLTDGGQTPFDVAASKQLYDAIVTPEVAKMIGGKSQLLVATGDILSAIPLTMLVSKAGKDAASSHFLIEDKAISVVPSFAALAASRQRGGEDGRLVAIGAPALQGEGAVAAAADYFAPALRSARLGKLAPLPGAKAEMEAVARLLEDRGAPLILEGEAATEPAVKSLDLSHTGVLLFATHGLVAGSFDGDSEPALVLTPPKKETPDDDGLLTASEAAALDIGADWVILSACDTAAGGRPSAAGYTGLARGFLFAGAKRVVASHWPVRDDISARLSVGIVEAAKDGLNAGQALRKAVLAVKRDEPNPALWAPFMVVAR